jgi:gliding motility-associated-like protein
MNMRKTYFFIIALLFSVSTVFAQTPASGDYVATASMEWNSSNWSISNGAGGYSSTGVAAPTAAKNVFILSGATVTVVTTAAVCNNLTVNTGGILNPTAAITVSGITEMDGTLTMGAGAYTATGVLNVLGTWVLNGALTTNNNVNIEAGGIIKGTTTAGGTVQTFNINGASPTVTVLGQLGGPSKGVSGESIRVFIGGSGTTTLTGTGKVCIARFQPLSTVSGTVQNFVIDIDMNIGNTLNTATGFTLQSGVNASGAKSLTINQGKTVTLSSVGGGFHNIANATTNATSYANMTYNINGTLDVSTGVFAFYTSTGTTSPSPTASLILNVGSTGVLKLGAYVRMGKLITTQTAAINVAAGGVVDGSGAALNLTTTPVSANGTSSADAIWFTLSPGSTFKRLAAAGVATPLWIGPANTNYNPVTVTPTTASVFTAAVAAGNSPTGSLNTTLALNRTWTITPATPSSTTLTFGYNGTALGAGDANSGCDPTAAMKLWYNNGSAWSLLTPTAVAPVAGTENDKTVTFSGITSFPTFALLNDFTASTNAALSALSTSSGTLNPVFATGTNAYTATVSNATTSITVTPTTSDATASVTVNGTGVASGSASGNIALNVGTNIITTVVTAQDGVTTSTYTLTVTRAQSSDANLSNIALSTGAFSPAFNPTVNTYSASVTNAVASITVTPTVEDPTATLTINGTAVNSGVASGNIVLNAGNNTITLLVTAQDGTTTNSYTLTVYRAPSTDANLAGLILSAGTLSSAFAATTTTYTESVDNTVSSITFTPTVEDVTATVTVNGTAVASGSASAAIPLSVGNNTVTTVVTAQDGTTTGTYTVVITRAASSNAALSALLLSSGALSPAFTSVTTAYTVSETNAITSLTITPTAADATAIISVNGNTVTSGSASGSIPINVGVNTITVTATAQDGVTINTYTLTVTRAQSSNASLSDITLNAGTLSPAFTSATLAYGASVVNATTSVQLTPTVADSTASVTVNGTTVLSGSASSGIPLNLGNNNLTITVTAQDGTTNTYTVVVNRALSSNADLTALALSAGILEPSFSSSTTTYAAAVPLAISSVTLTPTVGDATASVKINGTSVTSGSASGAIPLNVGNNIITTDVTAQDGTVKTYTLTVNRTSASTNANLSALVPSAGTLSPVFASGTTTYTALVSNATTSITLIPTAADATATVTVNGNSVTSGSVSGAIALNVGANVINTIIKAQDGITTLTYQLTVTRAPSSNASLASMALSTGTLSPAFASGTLAYTSSVPNATTSVTLTPTLADATATVTVNGTTVTNGSASSAIALAVGNNTITATTTAQDGTTINIYTITVTRAASGNANLASLAISDGTLNPIFTSGTTAYTASVPNAVTSLTITPTVADATATVTVNGTAVTSGAASGTITLAVGANVINIATKAQDGTTIITYQVTVTRAASGNSALSSLALSDGTLSPVFATTTTVYTASVANATTSVTLTPTVADATATVKVNGTTVASGSASGAIALNVGANVITTSVTAQDGTTISNYTVTITRAASSNASLAGIVLSNGTLSPAFASGTYTYAASVLNAITNITLTPTVADATASVSVNGIAVTSGSASSSIVLDAGDNSIPIVVTAADGVTKLTYTVIVTRPGTPQIISFAPISAVTYGKTDFSAGVTSSNTTLPITYASSNTAVATISSAGLIHILSAGSTTITASQAGNINFDPASPIAQTLTVNQAPLTITANSATKVYGAANPTLSLTYSGFIMGESAVNLNTQPLETTLATASSAVGSYSIVPSGAAATNYSIIYVNGSLNVTPAALTITANNQTKVYGAANPALTVAYSGFITGDDATKLTTLPIVNTSATAASPVGSYTLTPSGAVTSNYTITYATGSLTVTPAALNLVVANQTRTYGAVNPAFTISGTGFANGDNLASLTTQPVVTSTATVSSPVNTYPITASGAASANYTITYTVGSLTVTAATLTITANNQSRAYLVANPALTFTYSGFVNNETGSVLTAQPIAVTTATTASGVGTYPITISGAADANYSFVYVPGTLSITPASRVLTFNAIPNQTYGNPDFPAGALVNTNDPITYTSSNTAVATIINGNIHIVGGGTATITANVAATANYIAQTASQQLLVNAAAQVITFNAIPLQQNGNVYLTNAVSNTGLQIVLTTSDQTVAVPYGLDLKMVGSGTATITATQSGNANYLPAIVTQMVTVVGVTASQVFVHHGVSPNGDGVNDFLVIDGIKDFPDNKLTIVNRNGAKEFQITGYDNATKVFDGHSNSGSMMQMGTYFYELEFKANGENQRKVGYIILKNQ